MRMKNIFDTSSDEKDSRIVEAFSNGNGSRVSIQPVAHVAGSHEAVGFPGNHGNRKSAWVEIYRKSSGPDHSPVTRGAIFRVPTRKIRLEIQARRVYAVSSCSTLRHMYRTSPFSLAYPRSPRTSVPRTLGMIRCLD